MASLDDLLRQLGIGGVTRNRAGQIVTNTNDVVPGAMAGLADTLYGAGRGTLAGTASIAGLPGDVNQLYVNNLGALFPNQPAPPTSEQISTAVKKAVPPLNLSRDNTGSVATSLGENVVAPITAPESLLGAARATKGLPVGMSIQDVSKTASPVKGLIETAPDMSYRSTHEAPGPHFGAQLHDLTGGGQMYPADVYSPKAVQYYGTGFDKADQQAFAIANSVRGNPNATVTMYRAVPKELSNSEKLAKIEKDMATYMKRKTLPKDANTNDGSKWYDSAYEERERLRQLPDEPVKGIDNINAGDWVTLTKDYAKQHGESVLNGKYKIISKKVKAKDLWTNADSIQEFGYNPSK